MSVESILIDWKRKNFKPIYWLEGEEEYFIDKAINYAEHNILNEEEAAFNLSIFYGKDTSMTALINTCRRYPMAAERQVIILKEAQQMKDIEKLETYVDNPLASTVLIASYKDKKLHDRQKSAKTRENKGVWVTTKTMYDSQFAA